MEPHEKYPYPAGYEHVAERVAVDVERIRVIDAEIDRLRTAPEPGPQPRLTPAGEPVFRQPTNAEMTAYLKKQKEQIQQEGFERVDKEAIREKNPTTQRVLRDAARNELFGNPYEGMHEEQMHATRQQQRDLNPEQSADYMEAQRGKTPREPATTSVKQPQKAAQPEKSVFLSPSAYAMQSLTYTRIVEQADKTPAKSVEPSKSPAKENPGQTLSPSEMASLSLNYTVVTQQADTAPSIAKELTQEKTGPSEPDLVP